MASLNSSIDLTTQSSNFQFTSLVHANHIKFGTLLVLQLLSILCFLGIFLQFIRKRHLRQNHHHHVIFLLLLVSFLFVTIALPLTQAFLYTSYVFPANDTFCSFWICIHYSLNITNLFLMAFASLERNWLVFHPWLVRSKRGRFIFHYCPLACCVLYPPVFYIAAIFIYECEPFYDFKVLLCTWPCYFYNDKLGYLDQYFNNYTPLLIIPICCTIVYVRLFFQKRTMRQQGFKWARDKKMILQLWAISSLYLGMWMPMQLSVLINTYWDPQFLVQAQIDYMYLFPYLVHIIYPFLILIVLNKELFSFRRNPVAVPTVIPT